LFPPTTKNLVMRLPPLLVLALGSLPLFYFQSALATDSAAIPATKIALIFTGGHDTDPRDRGRPVGLIAAALGVPAAVFREAFVHVQPAPAGEQPDPAQIRLNKEALLQRLGLYGVTNERLDEVSNYYRYRRESGELWRHVDASGFALIRGYKIVSITMTNPGAGYTSAPLVSLPVGLTVYPMAILAFGTDLSTNGSISKIELTPIGDMDRLSGTVIRKGNIQIQDVHVQSQTQGIRNTPAPSR
jgi:hypothetical protein